jgi:hypothetical protein
VKGVGQERERRDEEADGQFDEEEDDVDRQHNADAGGFGPRHDERFGFEKSMGSGLVVFVVNFDFRP